MSNPILQFYRHYRKNGLKKTLADWKYNYIMLDTPEQIMKKEVIGYIGSIIGMLFAMYVFFLKDTWHILIAMGFGVYIMYLNLKLKLRQLQSLRDIKEKFEEAL